MPAKGKTGAPKDAGNENRSCFPHAYFCLSMICSENRCPLFRIMLYEEAFSTVTARRFCDQQEMSLQTATGRSLP